jgi:hypothetical protein
MSFLVGGRYGHADGAVGRHMAFEIDRRAAGIENLAAPDLHAIAISRVAGGASRHDQNTPLAVIGARRSACE